MSIKMAIKAAFLEKYAESELIAQVYRHDADKGDVFIDDINIPLIDFSSDFKSPIDKLREIDPGQYVLQLSLPSGDVITEDFQVTENGHTELVINLGDDKKEDWKHPLSVLKRHRSKIKDAIDTALPKGRISRKLKSFHLSNGPLSVDTPSTETDLSDTYSLFLLSPGESDSVLSADSSIKNLSEVIKEAINIQSAQEKIGPACKINRQDAQQQEAENLLLFKFNQSGLSHHLEQNNPYCFEKHASLQRHYLVQHSGQIGKLICLPTPWNIPQGQANVELLVDTQANDSEQVSELSYSISISDPMISSALSYINMGAVHNASKLFGFKQANKMLEAKFANPFAATIGGYFLLFGLDRKTFQADKQEWRNWVANLDNWFPWLPDGAILHASMNLMCREHDNDIADAYKALMRAYQRGLPFFTNGLKMLIDGMRYFANEGDEEAKKCLAELDLIAMHTDPAQPFLSINFATKE